MPEVTLFHFNDFHRKLEPMKDGMGGAARLVGTLRELKQQHPGSLTVNVGDVAGDNAEPGPDAFSPVADLFDRGQVDLLALGNHEFEDPTGNYKTLREGLIEPFDGEVLSANIDLPGTKPYTVKQLAGMNIAFIGVCTQELASKMFPNAGAGIVAESIEHTLRELVPRVRAEGADAVVVLAHEGLDEMLEVTAKVPGIDLTLAAHDHRMTDAPIEVSREDGSKGYVAEAGGYGEAVGEVNLRFENGRLLQVTGRMHAVDASSPVDPEAESIVANAPQLDRVTEPTKKKWKEVSLEDLAERFGRG